LRSFNILPYAYKHLLSKLSPAMDMEKFWANPDITQHKYKTDMATCRLLFSKYWNGVYWVGTSWFDYLETSTQVFVLTQRHLSQHQRSIISSLLLCSGIYLNKNFCHYKTCMAEWRWFCDLLFAPTAHILFTTYLHLCFKHYTRHVLHSWLRHTWIYAMRITCIS
jgi:hypothetical protein